MKQMMHPNTQPGHGQLEHRFHHELEHLGVADDCNVEIGREGHWFILHGHVDSQHTRTVLLGMVPQIDGARWIVDRLEVGRVDR